MNCPKCGHEQEERLDCKECGIIFSKYNALFQSPEQPEATKEDTLTKNEFQELQIQVRDLSSRLIEAEFEKAERKKLRADLNTLEDQAQQDQMQIKDRLQLIEDRLDRYFNEPESQITPDILKNLPTPEEIEQKNAQLSDCLNNTIDQCTHLWEKTGQNSYQISELRDQVASLRGDILALKSHLENLQKSQAEEEPKTIMDDDIKAIRRNLDELGQFISGLGRGQ
jgi:chromosome segregation ATPase